MDTCTQSRLQFIITMVQVSQKYVSSKAKLAPQWMLVTPEVDMATAQKELISSRIKQVLVECVTKIEASSFVYC